MWIALFVVVLAVTQVFAGIGMIEVQNKPKRLLWPGGVIPYEFDKNFKSNYKQKVIDAMNEWSSATCVTFRPAKPSDKKVINFTHGSKGWANGSGCGSALGMLTFGSRKQGLTLGGPGCFANRIILHELGHAIGLLHEQNHPQRDDFLTVHFENIKEAARRWYKKADPATTSNYGVPYDPTSVMHYGANASIMETKDPKFQKVIGRAKNLSKYDKLIVNKMYKCK